MRKVLFLIVLIGFFVGCYDDPPDNIVQLNVPYYAWDTDGYCSVACIQMWAAYDGYCISQSVISSYVGIPTTPEKTASGICQFTNAVGYVEWEPDLGNYYQDLCISYSIASVEDRCPSIMPFNQGNHAIITVGYQYHIDGGGVPIADNMTFHDPDPNQGDNLNITAANLKIRFEPSNGYYFVVVGFNVYVNIGIDGYNSFLMAGGTFYGGPVNYFPEA